MCDSTCENCKINNEEEYICLKCKPTMSLFKTLCYSKCKDNYYFSKNCSINYLDE